ncbi:zinc-binding dehydrogenase, partial [Streptomyces sp. NPDC002920]
VTLGAFAPYALVDHRHVITVPESLSWTDAAALPVALATEHDALAQGGFGLKQSVLVVGATSSVGLIGVQLAKALGASQVIATTTSDTKAGALKSVGADVVVNTASENLAETVAAAIGGAGADLTLDHVGGQLFADTFLATRIGGTVVNVGRLAGPESTIDLNQLAFRRLRVIGTTFSVRTPDELADTCAALATDVVPAVEEGQVRAVVDRVFAFDDAKAAADHMRSNTAVGKIVLEMPAS